MAQRDDERGDDNDGDNDGDGDGRRGNGWRAAGWCAAALLLALPLVAMQLTDQVRWGAADFALAAALLAGAGGAIELGVRASRQRTHQAAVVVAAGTALLLVWVNAAVGVVGSEDEPVNLLFGGVLLVGIVGTGFARRRAGAMAPVLLAVAAAQVAVAVVAVVAGVGRHAQTLGLTGVFVALWLTAALLFRAASRAQATAPVA